MRRDKPQNACYSDPPPSSPSWLVARARNAPSDLLALRLQSAFDPSSPLGRSLRRDLMVVRSEVRYQDGSSMVLIKGAEQEIARVVRLCSDRRFHPDVVLGGWLGGVPLPAPILESKPVQPDRWVVIVGFDADQRPNSQLLKVVSHDARIDLSQARRSPNCVGVSLVLAGNGRVDAIEMIEGLHDVKRLPSRERSDVVLLVRSFDSAQPSSPDARPDRLHLYFPMSRPCQLDLLIREVIRDMGPDVDIHADNCLPRPGKGAGAVVEIAMRPRKPDLRLRIEQRVRAVAEAMNMSAECSWIIDGVWHPVPAIG